MIFYVLALALALAAAVLEARGPAGGVRYDESRAPLAERSPRTPWDKWTKRGKPTQRQIREQDFPLRWDGERS